MDLLQYALLGLLLPTLAGATLARALLPTTPGCRYLDWLGFGWLLGVGLASVAMHLMPTDVTTGAIITAVVLVIVAIGALIAGRSRVETDTTVVSPPYVRLLWLMAALLAALVVVQTVLVAMEILIRPTYPWDAWSSWAYKAKAWFLVGHQPTFLAPQEWPRAAADDAFTILGAHYPTLIAGFQVYLAAWLGQWREPLLNLPWLFCYLALCLMFLGEARRATAHWGLALLATLAMASLPMLVTHTALAGYMDLWLASGLLGLTVAVARARQAGGWRAWALVVLLAGLCIGLKVEALVWVGLIALIVAGRLLLERFEIGHRVAWLIAGIAAAILIGVLTVTGGFHDGPILALPYLGNFDLTFNEGAGRRLLTLLHSWNWHLFYWLLAAVALFAVLDRKHPLPLSGKLFCDFTIASAMALCVLFLFTSVHGSTTGFTNYNRLLLQWVPVQGMCVFYLIAATLQARR